MIEARLVGHILPSARDVEDMYECVIAVSSQNIPRLPGHPRKSPLRLPIEKENWSLSLPFSQTSSITTTSRTDAGIISSLREGLTHPLCRK